MSLRPIHRLAVGLALLAGAALAGGCNKGTTGPSGSGNPPPSDGPNNPTPSGGPSAQKKAPEKADYTLTAEQLGKEFKTDKAAAEGKYKDKWIDVEGPVEDVDIPPAGGVTVRLLAVKPKGDDFGNSIRCLASGADATRVRNLTKGQQVKFRGKLFGETAGLFVDLNEGEVLSVGPDPAIKVTADQLTEEFAKDAAAAGTKYAGKWLLIEGTVSELKTGGTRADSVVLEGSGKKDGKPLRISAAYAQDRKDDFAALKKGDKVKVKGECGGEFGGEISLSFSRLEK